MQLSVDGQLKRMVCDDKIERANRIRKSQPFRMSKKAKRIATREKTGDPVAQPPKQHSVASPYSRGEATLFALTLFLSAALLFTVQPMFAKMVLPKLGGAPAVWNACLVFYQAALLGGYLYAHLSLKWLGPRRQAAMHLGLLALAWVSLPIRISDGWQPPATTFPAPWLWLLLTIALGLPFFAVSANAPMLQAWFARAGNTTVRRDPYFLYAASNLGSMLGLLSYPLLMEAHLTLAGQSLWWAIGFGFLTALVAACAARLWMAPASAVSVEMAAAASPSPSITLRKDERKSARAPSAHSEPIPEIALRRRFRWLTLSFVPSSLLMGVTTYITSEITQLPILSVMPLALYLLTFVLVFAPRTVLPLKWMLRVQPPLMVLAAASLLFHTAGVREMLLFGSLHLIVFFVTVMVCHGQLAADRPEPARLTEYYLWMSLGGVIGGLFCALLAPLLFDSALEYPLMLAEVGILGLGAGGIATYAEPGERFTFYEIDPAVERIARNPEYFTYLSDCRGKIQVILGDARLKLEPWGPERKVRSLDPRRLPFRFRARSSHDARGAEALLQSAQLARRFGLPHFQPLPEPGTGARPSRRRFRSHADRADLARQIGRQGGCRGLVCFELARDGTKHRGPWPYNPNRALDCAAMRSARRLERRLLQHRRDDEMAIGGPALGAAAVDDVGQGGKVRGPCRTRQLHDA